VNYGCFIYCIGVTANCDKSLARAI